MQINILYHIQQPMDEREQQFREEEVPVCISAVTYSSEH